MLRKVTLLCLLVLSLPARADEPKPPVFEGHPMLSTHTKEMAAEGSVVRLGDGTTTLAGGLAVAAFYKPWFSVLGAAHFAPGFFDTRQTYDTRGVVRLVYPHPFFDRLFVYGGVGVTVLFAEEPKDSDRYLRAFGLVGALGSFVQVADRFRIRLEVRDHWLLANGSGMRHNVFGTLSLVLLYR